MLIYNVDGCTWLYCVSFSKQYILQGSVSEHDSIESQSSGDGLLLHKLYEGETCRLRLISSHSHKLYISHLLEKLQQLVCSGGLWRDRRADLNDSYRTWSFDSLAPLSQLQLVQAVISLYSLDLVSAHTMDPQYFSAIWSHEEKAHSSDWQQPMLHITAFYGFMYEQTTSSEHY